MIEKRRIYEYEIARGSDSDPTRIKRLIGEYKRILEKVNARFNRQTFDGSVNVASRHWTSMLNQLLGRVRQSAPYV